MLVSCGILFGRGMPTRYGTRMHHAKFFASAFLTATFTVHFRAPSSMRCGDAKALKISCQIYGENLLSSLEP